jgi:hypothetical protein
MLDKCANPKCLAVFRCLADGKLSHVPRARTISSPSGVVKKFVAIEHFWLCNECAETMTLEIDRRKRVNVIPVLSVNGAAAS